MKNLIPILTMALLLGCASVSRSTYADRNPANSSSVRPTLFFQPAPIFDGECQQRTGFKIDASWQQELFQKLDQFKAAWEKDAESLIRTSEATAGRKFHRNEYSVALTLCKWTPMGDPAFIVSVRPYLEGPAKSDDKIKEPKSLTMFVSMTHHELLHSLVDNIINEDFLNASAMLEKYKAEHFNVLVHLHLMAIQKTAYEKLGRNDLLKTTDNLYEFIGGDYKRAWEIINLEGAPKFIAELQAYNGKTK